MVSPTYAVATAHHGYTSSGTTTAQPTKNAFPPRMLTHVQPDGDRRVVFP
jgi:hypothetical protein